MINKFPNPLNPFKKNIILNLFTYKLVFLKIKYKYYNQTIYNLKCHSFYVI